VYLDAALENVCHLASLTATARFPCPVATEGGVHRMLCQLQVPL